MEKSLSNKDEEQSPSAQGVIPAQYVHCEHHKQVVVRMKDEKEMQ